MEIITVVMVVLEALNELLYVKPLEHFRVHGKWNIKAIATNKFGNILK